MARKVFNAAPWPQVDSGIARLLPVATTILAAMVTVLPLRIPGDATLAPAFTLMAAYHWTIYRPDLLPPLALFAVGLTEDLLAGGPVGVGALLLLLARAAVLGHRRYFVDRSFPFVWAGFTILAGAAMLGLWALHCALDLRLFGLRNTIFRLVLTVAVFPIASVLLGRAQRALIGPL
jgi:rod shape-determining protein MreD